MKILYILSAYPNYSETFIQHEMDHLVEQGHKVAVLNVKPRKQLRYTGIKTYNNSYNPIKHFVSFIRNRKFRRNRSARPLRTIRGATQWYKYSYLYLSFPYLSSKAKHFNPDLIVTHFLFATTFAASKIAQELGCPYLLRLHTHYTTLAPSIAKPVIDEAFFVSTISNKLAEYIKLKYQYKHDINCIRQDINLPKLLNYPLKEYKVPYHFVAAGRLVNKKGFKQLIEAMALLKEKSNIPFSLNIYGEGTLKVELEDEISRLNLGSQVFISGRLTHAAMLKKINSAGLIIVPSIDTGADVDGIPSVIAEAMALNTLVLCSDVGSVSEIIEDKKTGYLLDVSNPQMLMQSIERAIVDKANWPKIKQQAREKVSKEFAKRLELSTKNLHL